MLNLKYKADFIAVITSDVFINTTNGIVADKCNPGSRGSSQINSMLVK